MDMECQSAISQPLYFGLTCPHQEVNIQFVTIIIVPADILSVFTVSVLWKAPHTHTLNVRSPLYFLLTHLFIFPHLYMLVVISSSYSVGSPIAMVTI